MLSDKECDNVNCSCEGCEGCSCREPCETATCDCNNVTEE